ncbi:MAG: zinc ribbon domain-containing protein [Planctomycetales bacterium]|nr:zinc ribbon domain-containing protein [Planctomycetales bacterium]
MAYCPECKGEMSATEIVCPHCGYDFPASGYNRNTRGGFASSAIAQGQFMNGLLVYPIACLLQLGMLVVFIRVQQ